MTYFDQQIVLSARIFGTGKAHWTALSLTEKNGSLTTCPEYGFQRLGLGAPDMEKEGIGRRF
jgi:hypothetical protein